MRLGEGNPAKPLERGGLDRAGQCYFDSEHTKVHPGLQQGLELKRTMPYVWTDMGVMYRKDGRPQEAIRPRSSHPPSTRNMSSTDSTRHRPAARLQDAGRPPVRAWEGCSKFNPTANFPGGMSGGHDDPAAEKARHVFENQRRSPQGRKK